MLQIRFAAQFLSATLIDLTIDFYRVRGKMYPVIDSKWLITISKLRHDFYTIAKKMIFCTPLNKLQLPNVNTFCTISSPKWQL